jgi:ABC-2 type transport system ATP-binding protein
MNKAIIVKNLTKNFDSFTAVDNISFEINSGEIFGFLGPNGAGKTTTIRMLCAIIDPSQGEAEISGLNLQKDGEKIKKRIGYMSQKFSLYEDLTIIENLEFYAGIYQYPAEKRKKRIDELISLLVLSGNEKKLAGDLPTGLKQRLGLACAIIHNPKIIFLDEPTAGTDPISRNNFWQHLINLSQSGTTVIVTTHLMDEAYRCNRLAFMHSGKIIALGKPNELLVKHKKNDLEELFISLIEEN